MATERVTTYKQLLKMAHDRGLTTITTELVQIPREDNERVAISRATITLERDGVTYLFQGIGDASPANVKPAMANCTIRFAETRAKARALRDAVNIGDVAAEELESYDEAAPAPAKLRSSSAGKHCDHCLATDTRPGLHHAPGCPHRQEAKAAA